VGMRPRDSGTAQSLRLYRRTGAPLPGGPSVGDPDEADDGGPAPSGGDQPPASAAGLGTGAGAVPSSDDGHDARTESRSELRAARRRRRRLSIGCAVLIAVCTAITIVIVAIARDRAPGPQVVTPAVPQAVSPSFDHHATSDTQSPQIPGALAPQGGQR